MPSISSDQGLLEPGSGVVVKETPLKELGAWGIDFSSYEVHLGYTGPMGKATWTAVSNGERDPVVRTASLYEACLRLINTVVSDYPPMAVAVEKPMGRSRYLQHAYAIIYTAFARELRIRFRYPVAVWTVGVNEWRPAVLGPKSGDYKQQSIDHCKLVLGFEPPDHNHADALNIAHWLKGVLT